MSVSRRSFLLGSVSVVVLSALPAARTLAASTPRPAVVLLPDLEAGIESMTAVIRDMCALITQVGPISCDFADERLALLNGGRAGFGIGESDSDAPGDVRGALAAEAALADLARRYRKPPPMNIFDHVVASRQREAARP